MKRSLFLLLCFLLVVFLGVVSYLVWFSPYPVQETPALSGSVLDNEPYSLQQSLSRRSAAFEESFYQDLSDFFNSDTNYYQSIQGDYWFIQP